MAGIASEETGVGRSVEVNSGAQNYQSSDALVEWRSSDQVENGMPSTSPPYWDSDDDDAGPKPSQLYGKHTWKIEKFSENTKRELRSEAFEVGGYKWYILIYPQGCDVCNHLSLFLCVANHDRLLPGWSHFAQFTIAVVNKDPKKSKYSDTLHRFWKKEHDWGWKKFMELSKVSEGFLDSADTLIIKAQVQVIREKTDRPFRCLDCVYRRELVRVYLTNLESICRRFMEDRQGKFGKLIEDKSRWTSLCAFWLGMDQTARRRMSREKTDTILKVMVKHFFIEKEVTSTLVMDSLYCGLKVLEGYIQSQKGRKKLVDTEEMTAPIVHVEKDMFVLVDDVLLLLERAAVEPLPPKDDKGPQNRTKDGNSGEDLNKDSSERDERRLTELGRRTVEIFILAHIFNHKIEVAYQEAVALKRQEELIREEEFEAWLACSEQKTKNGGTERDKKSKKKPSKQKRNSRKGKDKGKDEKSTTTLLNKNQEENPINDKKESSVEEVQPVEEKADTLEDVSDMSDSIDFVAEVPQPDAEDRDASPVNWDTDASEGLPPTEQVSCNEVSGLSSAPNGAVERRNTSAMDDSSSTCSTDSILSVPVNGYGKENGHLSYQCEKSSSRGKKQRVKLSSDGSRTSDSDAGNLNAVNGVSRSGESVAGQGTVSRTEQHAVRKEQEDDQFQKKWSVKCTVDSEQSSKGKAISALSLASSPMSPERNGSSPVQLKSDNKHSPTADCDTVKLKKSLSCIQQSDKSSLSTLLPHSSVMTKAENQHAVSLKLSDGKVQQQVPPVSRPSSAPLVPGPRPTTPAVSLFQTSPLLARSVSVASRLGPDASMATQGYVPQSYRNAIIGSTHSSTSGFSNSSYLSSNSAMPPAHTQPPSVVSSPMLLPQNSGRIEPGNIYKGTQVSESGKCMDGPQKDVGRSMPGDPSYLTNGFRNLELHQSAQSGFCDWSSSELPACTSGRQTQGMVTDEFPHLDIINDLLDDEYGAGIAAGTGRIFHPVSNGPQLLNRQFSFPGEVGASSNLSSSTSSSCRFERTRSYHDVGFGRGYSSVAAYLDSVRDFIPQANPHPFLNDQIEGMIPNQWQLGGANHSIMDMRNIDSEGLAYLNPRFPNVVNGYTVYRPSNGY